MEKLQFLSYVRIDGIPTIRNTQIRDIYNRCVETGIADMLFHDGSINDSEDFLQHVTRADVIFTLIFVPGENEPMGFFWLNRLERTHAYCHFAAFPEYWGKPVTVKAGQQAMDWCLHTFHTIMGMVPISNKYAIDYLYRVGLKDVGDIPNLIWSAKEEKPVTGKLMYITREALNESIHKD